MNNMIMDPNQDRSNNMMPTQAPFMRYVSSAPIRRNYQPPVNAAPLKRELIGDQDKLPMHLQEAIKNSDSPANRKNKFCGGMSKPYSRKK